MTTGTLDTTAAAETDLDTRIATRRAELQARRDAIPDDGSLPSSTTRDDLAAVQLQRRAADRALAEFNAAIATAASLGSAADDERWRDQLIDWRSTLNTELMALRGAMRQSDAHTHGRVRNLALSMDCIDDGPAVFTGTGWGLETSQLGALMITAGHAVTGADPSRNYLGSLPWRGNLRETERRLATLSKQRAQAEANLEAALRSDAERAAYDAEREQYRDIANRLHLCNGTDPYRPSLIAYKNGDVWPPEEMTPAERAVFDAENARVRAEYAARLAAATVST